MVKRGFWKKKDGKMIKIKDMEDMHLIHVIELYKSELLEGYPDPDSHESIWVEGSLPVKFFELQFEAYGRDILPEDELILDSQMPEEYIPEGMYVGLR
jgi:hypothetical protein